MDIPLLVRDFVFFLGLALFVILLTRKLAVPYTLGLVVAGLGLGLFRVIPEAQLTPDLVFFVFLPPLLFEGGWSVKLSLLKENWRVIFFLAGPGLLLSLVIVAGILQGVEHLDWLTALVLAAILSPTDPVAVLGLFRQLHVNEHLATIIEGESLFNDGVAGSLYQIFVTLLLLSLQGHQLTMAEAWGRGTLLFIQEALGGVLVGGLGSLLISQGLKRLDDPLLATTMTLLAAYGLYWLADVVHVSALVAVIVAGLILGSYGRRTALSERTRSDIETFWQMLAFLANACIFLLIGIQMQVLTLRLFDKTAVSIWGLALFAVAVVLLSRLALVLALRSWTLLPRRGITLSSPLLPRQALPHSWSVVIFWSGLRGALSLALVLALPAELPARETLVISTYAVVAFTLLVQGLSLRRVLRRALGPRGGKTSQSPEPDGAALLDE